MAFTGQELVDLVQDNLGNRESGTLGTRGITDAILARINLTIRDISRSDSLPIASLQRYTTLAVTTSYSEYALPTTDVDGATIAIRVIRGLYGQIADSTDYWEINRVTLASKLANFPFTDSSAATGRPTYYAVSGGSILFHPYPSEAFTCHIYAVVWPSTITLAQTQPLGDNWDDVIEAGTTARLFQALQEPEDAAYWLAVFQKRKELAYMAEKEKPDWNPLFVPRLPTQPWNDPFIKSWN